MIRFFVVALVAMSSLLSGAYAVEEPLPPGGQVTLTWANFNVLWTELEHEKQQIHDLQNPVEGSPLPFALSQAAYRGVVEKSQVTWHARFELSVFEPNAWVKVPFFPSSVGIQSATLDGHAVGLMQENGTYDMVFKGAGHHVLEVHFSSKAPSNDEAPHIHLDVLPTPVTALSLELPLAKVDVHLEPSQGWTLHTSAHGTLVTAALPSTGTIDLRWQKAAAEDQEGPAKVYLDANTLITVSQASIRSTAQLTYNVLHRGVRRFEFRVPSGWNVLSVEGDGPLDWKRLDPSRLVITEGYPRKGAVLVTVTLERALGEQDHVLDVAPLQAVDIEQESGTIAVEVKGGMDAKIVDSLKLSPIDPQELPGALWQAATQPIVHAFRYTGPAQKWSLSVTRPVEASVLTTTVDLADALMLLTDRGQVLTQVSYTVRNHLKPYISVRLPAGAEVWSAFVAGEAVKPTSSEANTYRIPLAKSQIEDGGKGFLVQLVYYQKTSPWSLLSFRDFQFPLPDAPVSRLRWSLSVPERYRILHLGGDVQPESEGAATPITPPSSRAFASTKPDVTNGVSFQRAAINVQKKSKDFEGDDLTSDSAPVPTELKTLPSQGEPPARADEAQATGVFPIAFQLPSTDHWRSFTQVIVVGTEPHLTGWFVHQRLTNGGITFGLGALVLILVRRREHVRALHRTSAAFYRQWKRRTP